jgi:hypothetical protein
VADTALGEGQIFWIKRCCTNKRRLYDSARNNVFCGEAIRPRQARRQYILQRRKHRFGVRALSPVRP